MTLKVNKIANPFAAFAISWLVCLILYSLGWTSIFPPISVALFLFLGAAIIVFGITGYLFNYISLPKPEAAKWLSPKTLVIANAALYSLNFLYSGVPLITGIRTFDFGIPTVIVVATTLNSFTAIYCFYCYLLSGKKKLLLYMLVCFGFFILVLSRGNIMMCLVTMFFLWINVKLPALNFKKIIGITCGVFLVMYLFGVAGNYRTINGIKQENPSFDAAYSSEVILTIGGATDNFKNSIVPGEFFWTYLYITSPLSNLQYNVDKNDPPFSLGGIFNVFVDELLFDTVSKRVDDILGRERKMPDLVVEQLSVPTTLTGSYNYAGWGGMAFFLVVFWLFPFIYTILVAKNPLGIIGLSTLCTVYFFSIFDNMFILTGLTFQILYPILIDLIGRISLPGREKYA